MLAGQDVRPFVLMEVSPGSSEPANPVAERWFFYVFLVREDSKSQEMEKDGMSVSNLVISTFQETLKPFGTCVQVNSNTFHAT